MAEAIGRISKEKLNQELGFESLYNAEVGFENYLFLQNNKNELPSYLYLLISTHN